MWFRTLHHCLRRNSIWFFGRVSRECFGSFQCKAVAIGTGKHGRGDGRLYVPLSLSLFGFLSKEENPEDKLITTIKRAILCINREQYDKAEQMLHLALRMAQDLQSEDGVTYVYDIMANLALERDQYKKSEKLFAEVIKRLMAKGLMEDDLKVLYEYILAPIYI